MNGNQWGILTEVSTSYDRIDTTFSWDEFPTYKHIPRYLEFKGIAPATPQILSVMSRWMNNPNPKFPIFAEEWMCLYCASPNPLPLTHCEKCGAPRNWIIG